MQISFVIPARNEEKLLPGCVAAIKSSPTDTDVSAELIVVSDASTDRTVEVAHQLGCQVVCVSAKSRSVARNIGAEQALGDVLVFIDADTRIAPDFVAELCALKDDAKQVYWFKQKALEPSTLGSLYFVAVNALSYVTPTFSPAIAVKRGYWSSHPPFDTNLKSFEDFYYLRLAHNTGYGRYVLTEVQTSVRRIVKFGLVRALIHFWCALRDPYNFEWKAINE